MGKKLFKLLFLLFLLAYTDLSGIRFRFNLHMGGHVAVAPTPADIGIGKGSTVLGLTISFYSIATNTLGINYPAAAINIVTTNFGHKGAFDSGFKGSALHSKPRKKFSVFGRKGR
jgi:hypothetical protein